MEEPATSNSRVTIAEVTDPRLRVRVTTRLAPVVYLGVLVVVPVLAVALVVLAFTASWPAGVAALAVAPLVVALVVASARLLVEALLALDGLLAKMGGMADSVHGLGDRIDDLGTAIPRLPWGRRVREPGE